jgi:hypothetical protein
MSVDFNAVMNNAWQEAQKRRQVAASSTAGLLNQQSVEQSGGTSELSVEDIANAMKNANTKKHEDTDFVSTHGKEFKITEDEKLNPVNKIVAETHNKIAEIKHNAEIALDRQAAISKSLKSYQNNVFVNKGNS